MYGCEKGDNLVLESNQEYLGNLNTFREYETTTSIFEAHTETPFVRVPDSLDNLFTIDSIHISKGIAKINFRTETLIAVDTTWNHNLPYPEIINGTKLVKYSERFYDLEDEMEKILNGEEYIVNENNGISGEVWIENDTIMGYYSYDSSIIVYLKKPLNTGKEWVRNSRTYTNDNNEKILQEEVCRVTSYENVYVNAGTFMAYKIEKNYRTGGVLSTDYTIYEYYSPGIGLILKEYDMNLNQTSISLTGETTTIYFRNKYRKELVNYSFLQNEK